MFHPLLRNLVAFVEKWKWTFVQHCIHLASSLSIHLSKDRKLPLPLTTPVWYSLVNYQHAV